MNFIKNAMNSAKGSSSQKPASDQAAGGQQDYVDKAFDAIAKKSGHNIDRNTSEKITDAGRGFYEKATGKKVDPKYSN
ncbi:hypothetical protein B0T10DRAFT_556581 [Thelonectria olida]|uniref:Uncharacterized protein n=1 Tax=Thelonectria olida TaxID=1576542 RepID=A0A9P9AUH1_9HYPO|nr:hypothetical protein B0T10DRAFT_556581 [Thelonectria olida]